MLHRFVALIGCFCLLCSNISITKAATSCKALVADIVLMVDISKSVVDTIVKDRSFIRTVIDGFPIDGKTMRMGFVVFSSSCKTLVTIDQGISHQVLYEALEKPWFPIWDTEMGTCIDKVIQVDLLSRKEKSRKTIVVLITDAAPSNLAGTTAAIKRLQEQDVKFFMIMTNEKDVVRNQEVVDQIGRDNVVEAARGVDKDDRVAQKMVDDVCKGTCSTEEREVESCGWEKNGNCVRKIEVKVLEANDPVCKGFRSGAKILPCQSNVCIQRCDGFSWGQWDKICCGKNIGKRLTQTRTRTVPDSVHHVTYCPRVDTFTCTIDRLCVEQLRAVDQKLTAIWYVVCLGLIVLLLLLAVIAAICLKTGQTSDEQNQCRLKPAGVYVPPLEKTAKTKDAQSRMMLADLPLSTCPNDKTCIGGGTMKRRSFDTEQPSNMATGRETERPRVMPKPSRLATGKKVKIDS